MKIAFNLALGLLLIHPVIGEDLYLETQVKLRIAKKDEKRSREGGLEHVPFATSWDVMKHSATPPPCAAPTKPMSKAAAA